MRQTMAFRSGADFARLLLAAAAIGTFVDHLSAAEDVSAVVPLVLELTVGAAGGAELHQEIVVAEGQNFRVVTQCTHAHWYVEGHVDPNVGGIAHVRLKYGVSMTEAWNVATTSFDLPIDGFVSHGGGAVDGPYLGDVWLRRGLDPVPVLIRSIAKRDIYCRSAISRLGQFGERAKPAVPELIKVLNDPSVDSELRLYESVRSSAAESLGEIGPSAIAAVDNLLHATHDDNPYLRLRSALALWRIAARPEAGVVAAKDLGADHQFVRYEAARTLREIGAGAQAAVPVLSKALSDKDGWMRYECARALWAIRRDPAALACLRDLSESDVDPKVRRVASSFLSEIESEQSSEQNRRCE